MDRKHFWNMHINSVYRICLDKNNETQNNIYKREAQKAKQSFCHSDRIGKINVCFLLTDPQGWIIEIKFRWPHKNIRVNSNNVEPALVGIVVKLIETLVYPWSFILFLLIDFNLWQYKIYSKKKSTPFALSWRVEWLEWYDLG